MWYGNAGDVYHLLFDLSQKIHGRVWPEKDRPAVKRLLFLIRHVCGASTSLRPDLQTALTALLECALLLDFVLQAKRIIYIWISAVCTANHPSALPEFCLHCKRQLRCAPCLPQA